MIEGSRRIIHLGLNFMFAPVTIPIDTEQQIKFQELLSKKQIGFDQFSRTDKLLTFVSTKGGSLEVRVGLAGPQVSQLLILSSGQTLPKESFIQSADAVCEVFAEVWKEPKQVIHCDSCLRSLYQVINHHAFQFLWEQRLKQKGESLNVLKRAVLGGGLRLVIPPTEEKKTQIELKIESYLSDSRMLFVEVQFAWKQPVPLEEGLNPRSLIDEIEAFNNDEVTKFIMGA